MIGNNASIAASPVPDAAQPPFAATAMEAYSESTASTTGSQQASQEPSRSGMGKGVVVGAVAVLAAAIGIAAFLSMGGGDKLAEELIVSSMRQSASSADLAVSPASPNQPSSSSGDSASVAPASSQSDAADQTVVYEDGSVRITMPASFADAGYAWSSASATSAVLCNRAGTAIARIVWGESATYQDEAKSSVHTIGVVSHGSKGFTAYLRVRYLDDRGRAVYAGSPDAATSGMLATDLMGISESELVSWIELCSVNSYVPARFMEADSTSRQNAPTEPTALQPFWGVWIGASKDAGEADFLAQQASDRGLHGLVFVTTDWNNLNDEFWYVVTAGFASTGQEAQALLDRAIAAGYTDAYVKYSGDYQG